MRCIEACPFHAPKLNPKTNRADKCNFCVERIDEGLKPVCVENCVTGALSILKEEQKNEIMTSSKEAKFPIVQYTNPSVLIIKKRRGKIFLKEAER
jgi:Fe-S-cluster-containing dehydrogenase component